MVTLKMLARMKEKMFLSCSNISELRSNIFTMIQYIGALQTVTIKVKNQAVEPAKTWPSSRVANPVGVDLDPVPTLKKIRIRRLILPGPGHPEFLLMQSNAQRISNHLLHKDYNSRPPSCASTKLIYCILF